jgi:chemotaxis signal transduction protein
VSEDVASDLGVDRLMTFDVAGTVYALPISEVLEVVEHDQVACIPALPRECGGVMNWHGEALPVVAPHLLLGGEPITALGEVGTRQFLVIAERGEASASLGLPIDGVTGLVNGEPGIARGLEVVVERRPVDGRVVSVINPQRLVARAVEVIESAVA